MESILRRVIEDLFQNLLRHFICEYIELEKFSHSNSTIEISFERNSDYIHFIFAPEIQAANKKELLA